MVKKLKQIEVKVALVDNDYIPAYSVVHLPEDKIVKGKILALEGRKKPRDFYDYFFLLSGNYANAKEKKNLAKALAMLKNSKLDFRAELRRFLPSSHAMHLRDFKKILEQKIQNFGIK